MGWILICRGDKEIQTRNLIKKDATVKVLYKFNRLLKLYSKLYYKISSVGKVEPKTTREEYQNLGISEVVTGQCSVLISFLGSPKENVKETRLVRLPASPQWRKVGAGGAGRGRH